MTCDWSECRVLLGVLHFTLLDGVQPGVGGDLRKLVDLSQTRAPSLADAAELRPCHPRPGSPVELDERYRRDQKRCLKLLAVKHEVVRHLELLRRHWR